MMRTRKIYWGGLIHILLGKSHDYVNLFFRVWLSRNVKNRRQFLIPTSFQTGKENYQPGTPKPSKL